AAPKRESNPESDDEAPEDKVLRALDTGVELIGAGIERLGRFLVLPEDEVSSEDEVEERGEGTQQRKLHPPSAPKDDIQVASTPTPTTPHRTYQSRASSLPSSTQSTPSPSPITPVKSMD